MKHCTRNRRNVKILSLNETGAASIAGICGKTLSKKGSVLLLPTETVYGFMCLWDDQQAREKILKMKRRDSKKPFQMLSSSVALAEKQGLVFEGEARKIADKFFPGALTLIVCNRDGGTTGLRIPNHEFMQELLGKIGCPLAATSANISGEPAALTIEDALKDLEIFPDLAVDGGRIEHGKASTLVDATTAPFRILRDGLIGEDAIRRAVK